MANTVLSHFMSHGKATELRYDESKVGLNPPNRQFGFDTPAPIA